MNRTLLTVALASALAACASTSNSTVATPGYSPAPMPVATAKLGTFGVDLSARDTSVKPGDDFNRYASGHWLDTYQLKDDETSFGSFRALRDESEAQTRLIFDDIANRNDLAAGSNGQKVRDYYNSFMDRDARNAAGIAPLKPVLDKIAAITTMSALVKAFGESDIDGTSSAKGRGVAL